MRPLLLLSLLACGGPYAPVSFEMTGLIKDDIVVTASKKLNADCVSGCEYGQAVESGGCKSINPSTLECEPGGDVFMPFRQADGGFSAQTTWMIAPGSDVQISDFSGGRCMQAFKTRGATTVTIEPSTSECRISVRL